jgi:hypothetical protein
MKLRTASVSQHLILPKLQLGVEQHPSLPLNRFNGLLAIPDGE